MDIKKRLEEIQRRKVEILDAQKQYIQTHRLEFFKPHEKQALAFSALQDERKKTIVLLGGNRSGKSDWGAAAVCSFLEGRYPWIERPSEEEARGRIATSLKIVDGKVLESNYVPPKKDPGALRFKPPVRIRIIGEDYEKAIGQVIIPKLEKFLLQYKIVSRKKNQSGVYCQYVMVDGSVIDLLSYSQDPGMMEGWDGHVVWFDEPPPRDVYIANQRGLVDHGGVTLFTMTPLKEPWIWNEVVCNPREDVSVIEMSSYDNPYIKRESIDSFKEKLNADAGEVETRIYGKFLHLQGLVFKEFKKSEHVIEPFDIPKNWTCYVAIDTHPRTEQAVVFVVVDERDQLYVIHEIFKHGTPEGVAEWVIEFHDEIHKVHRAIIEPGSVGDQNRGDSTFQIIERKLGDYGIPLSQGSKDLAGGILQIRQVLKTPNGRPALFIFDSCQRLIWEFMNYVWTDWSSSMEKNEKQRPRDKDDHEIECLRRIVQYPARYIDPRVVSSLVEEVNRGYIPLDDIAGY